MLELTAAELEEKYPHGFYIERKKYVNSAGETVVYLCRRKKRAPKPRKPRKETQRPAITREINTEMKKIPLKKRARILEVVRQMAYSESDSSPEESDESAEE